MGIEFLQIALSPARALSAALNIPLKFSLVLFILVIVLTFLRLEKKYFSGGSSKKKLNAFVAAITCVYVCVSLGSFVLAYALAIK